MENYASQQKVKITPFSVFLSPRSNKWFYGNNSRSKQGLDEQCCPWKHILRRERIIPFLIRTGLKNETKTVVK